MSNLNIEKLNEIFNLKEKGILNQEEYETEKQKILNHSDESQVVVQKVEAGNNEIEKKDRIITLLLLLFLGGFGVHRFYTGHILLGILYLFSLGFLGLGVLCDLIWILTGSYKDSRGFNLK
jgi:TM2 domain-containing membrane protein YozV